MKNEDRIIIGESGLAGLPISAPLETAISVIYTPTNTLRWRKTDTSFVLEQWTIALNPSLLCGVWVEVPCVDSPRT